MEDFFGAPWEAIVIGRMMGAAVHPLASGLVVMGWWEWRRHRNPARLAVRFLTGAGVHAIWNGSIVALGIAATAFDTDSDVRHVHSGLAGLHGSPRSCCRGLPVASNRIRCRRSRSSVGLSTQPTVRVVGAWIVLSASFLIPMAILILAYPGFVGGG